MDEMEAQVEAIERENALMRLEIQRMRAEMDKYRRARLENVRKKEYLQGELARATGEIRALQETIRQMKDEDALDDRNDHI